MSTKTNSQVLGEIIHNNSIPLLLVYDQFWKHAHLGQLVTPFLVQKHQIIRASVPLMETASIRAAESAKTDALSRSIHQYLEVHIDEERHHDEWILEDLESVGIKHEQVLALAPSATIASMVGAQYYWINHHHPVALLGYIRIMESDPPSTAQVERLKEVSGLPDSVFRTCRLHGELDPNHLQEFDDMLDALPLTTAHAQLAGTSATFTAHLLANCLGELLTAVEQSV